MVLSVFCGLFFARRGEKQSTHDQRFVISVASTSGGASNAIIQASMPTYWPALWLVAQRELLSGAVLLGDECG
jgi:hypothetical protein